MGLFRELVAGVLEGYGVDASEVGRKITPYVRNFTGGLLDGWVGLTYEPTQEDRAWLDTVSVEFSDDGELELSAPHAHFVSGPVFRVLTEGTGRPISETCIPRLRGYVVSVREDWVEETPDENVPLQQFEPWWIEVLLGKRVGSAILTAIPFREGLTVDTLLAVTYVDGVDDVSPAALEPTASTSDPVSPPSWISQLKELRDLHEQGVLTDEEFSQAKQRLINQAGG